MPIPNIPNTTCIEHQPNDWVKVGSDYFLIISCQYKLTEQQVIDFKAKLEAKKTALQNQNNTDEITKIDNELTKIDQVLP